MTPHPPRFARHPLPKQERGWPTNEVTSLTRSRANRDGELSHVAVEILLSLLHGDLHGYAIKLDVEERIGGGFLLGSGSLYQALQRLERRGYIAEVRGVAPVDARRGRVYRLEPAGRRALEAELARMSRVLKVARRKKAAPASTK
jgi:PadR family transcriptional regulator PadR